MKLLAISGGPDSMFLLNLYKDEDVVVAHVNYHKRSDSNIDEKIVRDFCYENNILFESLSVNTKTIGNFQSWARNVRYSFFEKIYKMYNCNILMFGHHKDDFLETAIMQKESKRSPRYFGIKYENVIMGMNIKRPLLFLYWKSEILDFLQKNNIKFAIDSTNSEPIFERNRVRTFLQKKTQKEKENQLNEFVKTNKKLEVNFKHIDNDYQEWKNNKYNIKFFRKYKNQKEIIYEFINDNFDNINLSSKKMDSIIQYLVSPNNLKIFKLDKKNSVIKNNNFVNIFKKNSE